MPFFAVFYAKSGDIDGSAGIRSVVELQRQNREIQATR
jgi:hypothetical protein